MISDFDKLCNKFLAEEKQKGVDGKACWKGYKRMGTKKKGNKTVDNCVKIKGESIAGPAGPGKNDISLGFGESTIQSEKNATCTGPTKKASSTSKGKKYMKCVKSDSGGYKRIHWGQKGAKVTGKSGNTKRKKSFRARHKCSTAKANTPRGQACKDWQILYEKQG